MHGVLKAKNMKPHARLNKEFKDLLKQTEDGVHKIEIEEEKPTQWEVFLNGPEGTPFEKGVFRAMIDFTDGYPFKAPKVKFLTKIYHPNVQTSTGEICTQAVEENWVPTLNARFVISCLIELLREPRPADPLEHDIAHEFVNDYKKFFEKAAEFTATYALA